ncbi:molybdate transport system permease protein [Brevibacterium sandarakinum]|uniref:Molybdate transport system permease protein n=1 Tax=Brevibacterium sandarakinum TaxID=629680 RepID=A0A1H1YCS4_BRESA|nr:ABC transporter permease [Brevibacterium sandarakinum]SDT19089.1 molybdate transport system permease protein [Brevibacterium sandarakinum]
MTKTRKRHGHSAIPRWLWLPAVLGIAFLLVPIIGLVARIDPGHLGEVILAPESRLAMGLSLFTSVIAAATCVIIGFPLGYLLATRTFRGQRIVRTLILLPLVLPPVVSGLALLYTWGRTAFLGSLLTDMGLGLAYTSAAVVFAQIFVSLPFMVMSVETAVAARGQDYELAAAELGAKPNRVFFHITLPLLRQGIMTGAILCFARALGEFGATLTFAGSLTGVTRTMPLQIYLVRESDPQSAIALSLLLIVIALGIIVLAYRSPHAPRLHARRSNPQPEGAPQPTGRLDPRGGVDPTSMTTASDTAVSDAPNPVHRVNGEASAPTIRLHASVPERGLDVDLTMPAGSTSAMIGRNGAGKSSLFHIMTGAIPAESGSLHIGEDTIFDLAADRWPPVHARGIVHLAQTPLLFPHLSVIDNVAFGLRAHGHRRQEARTIALTMLTSLGVGHCADRGPEAVSGGQAARIALARALVIDPKLLLLDEPLAALDIDVKIATRRVLGRVLAGRSAIIITHDVEDVTALAATLVHIDSGTAACVAPVDQIEQRVTEGGADIPGHDFLASFCAADREGILCSKSQ